MSVIHIWKWLRHKWSYHPTFTVHWKSGSTLTGKKKRDGELELIWSSGSPFDTNKMLLNRKCAEQLTRWLYNQYGSQGEVNNVISMETGIPIPRGPENTSRSPPDDGGQLA